MKNILFKPIYFLALVILLSACSGKSDKRIIKLAHSLDISHPVHKGLVEMANILDKNSEGKMTIQIYANGQLGSERELLELLQIGSLDLTKVSSGAIENFVSSYKVLGLPYIFRDDKHKESVLEGPIGKKLLAKGSDYRLRGLCFYDAGNRSFYTKDRPINSPKDLEGLKIRVMNSQTAFDMVNALGGSPTPVSFGELYTALQQGVVDGAENNAPSFYTSRHYEVCKYYSIDQHTAIPDVLIVSTQMWNKLTDQEKKWLQAAADESVPVQKRIWAESVQESLEAVKKAGVEIIYPEKSPFQEKVQGLYSQYEDDPEMSALIAEIKQQQ